MYFYQLSSSIKIFSSYVA